MFSIEEIRTMINTISYPMTDNYFEKSSADGFAFLGTAKVLVGLFPASELKEIQIRNYSLNAESRSNDVFLPKYTEYVYTMWACSELLRLTDNLGQINDFVSRIRQIGCYDSGMQRYCSVETDYQVPNVSSAAALMFSFNNQFEIAEKFVCLLRSLQENGNWWYWKGTGANRTKKVREDSYHLAMMIYQLREIEKVSEGRIVTSDLISSSIDTLCDMNKKMLQEGSIGWGIPMLALALSVEDGELYKRALEETTRISIKHENFRTRAISAFVLGKIYGTNNNK